MELKHIKLFENFNLDSIKESNETNGFLMDWMPFDNYLEDPVNQEVPETVNSLKEAVSIMESTPDLKEKGLFIGLGKSDSGISMLLVPNQENKSDLFAVNFFDKEFKSKGMTITKDNITAEPKATAELAKYPEIYNEVISNYGDERKASTSSRLGDLGF